MSTLEPAGGDAAPGVTLRGAERDDLEPIVRMLASDPLGAGRERYEAPLPAPYVDAFDAIRSDPNQELLVACLGERVAGVLQVTFIPSLSYQGSWRAQIEGVRVDAEVRSAGIGRRMVAWAIDRCQPARLTGPGGA